MLLPCSQRNVWDAASLLPRSSSMLYKPKPAILGGLTWAELSKDSAGVLSWRQCPSSKSLLTYIVGVLRRQEISRGEEMGNGVQKHLVLSPELVLSSSCCQCPQTWPSPVPVQSHLPAAVADQSSGLRAWKQIFLCPPNSHCTDTIKSCQGWVLFRIRNTEPQKTVKCNRG